MNRVERLFAILLELQVRRFCQAEILAEHFGVSVRTVYRDIRALCECGVPIESEAGVGYRMSEGYFLPPLMLTPSEASCALLGLDFVNRNFDSEFRQASISAHKKLRTILSLKQRGEVERLCKSMRFVAIGSGLPMNEALMCLLRRAILNCESIVFHYEARSSREAVCTTRKVDPYAMVNIHGIWYLAGFCHLRNAMRTFRLERMEQLTVCHERFEHPVHFKLPHESMCEQNQLEVCVLFDSTMTRRVKEATMHWRATVQEGREGCKVTLRVRHEDEIIGWLLGWGNVFQVLAPESLKLKIAHIAQHIMEAHQT